MGGVTAGGALLLGGRYGWGGYAGGGGGGGCNLLLVLPEPKMLEHLSDVRPAGGGARRVGRRLLPSAERELLLKTKKKRESFEKWASSGKNGARDKMWANAGVSKVEGGGAAKPPSI